MTEGRTQIPPRRCPLSVVYCLFLAFVLIFSAGCGVKRPPFVSQQRDYNVRVDQLEGAWKDKTLVLKGLIQGDDASRALTTGCRVYYVWYSLDRPPCEGCPIDMTHFRDITGQIIRDGQFECRLPVFKQKGICFVAVRFMEKEGRLGPTSGRIKLISDL
ncbi:MAG: hypothetical protein JRD04_01250 [Deltaproteobacteria bacterium]|nr:hypothetical protein [Deltaproteobacteria bacterium]